MSNRPLALVLLGTAAGAAAVAVIGPLGLGLLQHRTSSSGEAQLVGADLAALVVVVPVCLVVAVLAWRGHPAAAPLALAPAGYATYTYTQYALGQEFLQLPGNVERFFPLLLGLVVLGGAGLVLGWTGSGHLPPVPSRLEPVAGVVLVVLAVFLVVGLHLPTLVDAMGPAPQDPEYLGAPTAFWLVKVMDLGLLVPLSLLTGVGLLRHRAWARRPMYAVLGAYTLIGTSVVGMAVVMLVRGADGASAGLAVGLGAFAAAFWTLSALVFRPLVVTAPQADARTRRSASASASTVTPATMR
jgi:hypothetical protein